MKLILGSSSPRRQSLFEQLHLKFEIISSDIEEPKFTNDPTKHILHYSKEKANAIRKLIPNEDYLLVTSDTIVWLNNQILGKPKDKNEACKMLKEMSSNKHTVYSGIYIYSSKDKKEAISFETTDVYFSQITEKEIDWYVNTGEPLDKAGAYGIQGYGSIFIKKIEGCYFNVMGFPINAFYNLLKKKLPNFDLFQFSED